MSTAWNRKRTHALLRIFFAFWMLCVAAFAARADLDVNGTKQALAALGQLQRDIQDMRGAMNAPLGPYNLETQCTWCSEHAWWGLGLCTQETTRTQRATVDFNWTRQQLVNLLNAAQAQANSFNAAYAPAQAWLRNLPGFNASFQQTSAVVLQVGDAIRAGQGPDDAQRQQVTQALQALVGALAASRQQLDVGTRALAGYLQQQASLRQQIGNAIGTSDQSAQQALASFVNTTKTWQCQGGLDQRFNQMRGDFNGATQRLSATFQQLQASSQAAEQGLATMTGTLVSAQGDYQAVLNQLQAAQNDQLGSFISRLHLDVARRQWQQLADYAVQVQ